MTRFFFQNGLLSALPYLMQAIFSISASIIADKIRARDKLTITTIRKIFNSFGKILFLSIFLPILLVFGNYSLYAFLSFRYVTIPSTYQNIKELNILVNL